MKSILLAVSLILIGITLNTTLFGSEDRLKKAISLANQEKYQEAISILKTLSSENPSDHRVFLSLGLVYRSIGNTNQAIGAFERSVAIQPTPEGYYSLGLLYEAMALPNAKGGKNLKSWLNKALNAWNHFKRLNPTNTQRNEVADRHIRQIQSQLK